MEDQSKQPETPRAKRIKERLERCAATETPGALDADLADAIIKEEKRDLLAEAKKTLPERMAAAIARLSTEERDDQAAIERVFAEEIKAFLVESGLDNPKPPPSSP